MTRLASESGSTHGLQFGTGLPVLKECIKRDGRRVPFDADRIVAALRKCFASVCTLPQAEQDSLIDKITARVVRQLAYKKMDAVGVEAVQDAVITNLWGEGLSEEATHYSNYREERRKARYNRPVSDAAAARVRSDRKHFSSDLQYFQFMDKFSRWLPAEKRRETWEEAVFKRVLPFLFNRPKVKDKLTVEEKEFLGKYMYELKAGPAMRVVQMAGPALERCNFGVFNCSYLPITDVQSFGELLYILMQGTGAGFSVEYDYVGDLPRVKKQTGQEKVTLVVQDTTESWCDTLVEAIGLLLDGRDFAADTSLVRKKGARLKTKGGRASGPEPLIELLDFVRRTILNRQGRRLSDLDVHDICCMIGNIVQVGGVRRAALISLSDLNSRDMRDAKSGTWWEKSSHRSMANNSAVYQERPSPEVFLEEWQALVRSKSGERGICNRAALERSVPERRVRRSDFGFNPCGEIILRPYGVCNLSIAVARPDDTEETLTQKVVAAAYFGSIQATCTDFKYVRDEWKKNAEEEALLGVDITGHADCPLLFASNPDRDAMLERMRLRVNEVNAELAARFGINRSAADTCVKPSGDSAIFFDCGSGISARFAECQWRYVRASKESSMSKFLIDQGVPYADAPERPNELNVFGFLKEAPAGSIKRNDQTAIEQLENWLRWKKRWAEHSVSATIYVEEWEWVAVGAWVYEHFDDITGLSFLPKDNGVYKYAPNVELTREQYEAESARFPEIEWEKLSLYEDDDETGARTTMACVGGSCD